MILLTVIAVGLLGLSSISLRSSSQGEAMATARANARLGLILALGELQKRAGPDQCITARAEILDSNTATPEADGVSQPYWTGVWKTGDKVTEVQRVSSLGSDKGQTAEWLVSNPDPSTKLNPKNYSGTTTGTNQNAVILASKLGATQTDLVAPLVKTGNTTTGSNPSGSYAFWVSDEGLKTKVNIKDPTLGVATSGGDYVKNLSHFATSQASAAHKILPSPLDTDLRGSDNIPKVISLDSLRLAAQNASTVDLRKHTPDITAHSWGVLANVRKGGLKNDLTAAFEDDGSSNAGQYAALKKNSGADMDGECVYRSTSRSKFGADPAVEADPPFSGSARMDGLRWRSLYHYYNLYKNKMPINRNKGGNQQPPAGIQSSNTGFSGGAHTIPQRVHGVNDDGLAGGAYMADPIVPVTLQARVDVALESFVDPATGNYRLRLRYYPMMVLWNPYSVRLSSNLNPSQSFYTNMFRRWTITIKVGSTGIEPFSTAPNNLFQGGGYLPTLNTKGEETATFEPGEIKIFTLADRDIRKTTLGDPASSNVGVFTELRNTGELADWCQFYDLPWTGTTNPADLIDVTVSNKSLDANATYNNGGPLTAWPDGNTYNMRISTYSPPSVSAPNSWPNPKPAISTMAGNPFLLVGFNYRAKGTKKTADTNYFNSAFNPPMFMGNSSSLSNINTVGYWREIYARNFKPYTTVSEVQNFNGRTSWGLNSVGADPVSTENSQLVLVDVPVQPMFSIGQFAHLSPFYYASSGGFQAQFLSSFFIGGSLASPNVSMNTTVNTSGGVSRTVFMDHSYLANQNLFDGFFFSTVPASKQLPDDAGKHVMKSEDLAKAIAKDDPLPNTRMRFYRKGSGAPKPEDLRDVKKAAANLLVDGAFNINSTSVNAWRALLSSLSGNDLKVWNPSTGSANVIDMSKLKNPIPRFWSTTNKGSVNQAFEGMRALSDGEVTELAEQIVRQIKERGPFLHMGDFLNRRLAPSATNKSRLYTMGALQAAIENTNINAQIRSAGTATSLNSALNGDPFGANVYGKPSTDNVNTEAWTTTLTSSNTSIPDNTAVGIPGYLMQQDLVQAFAPVMAARSDTFVIRAYGESKNTQGIVQARAWCEAVVQRLPDYLDPSDPALTGSNTYGNNLGDATPPYVRRTSATDPAALVNKTNEIFGRKFSIASFRWLNEKEI